MVDPRLWHPGFVLAAILYLAASRSRWFVLGPDLVRDWIEVYVPADERPLAARLLLAFWVPAVAWMGPIDVLLAMREIVELAGCRRLDRIRSHARLFLLAYALVHAAALAGFLNLGEYAETYSSGGI